MLPSRIRPGVQNVLWLGLPLVVLVAVTVTTDVVSRQENREPDPVAAVPVPRMKTPVRISPVPGGARVFDARGRLVAELTNGARTALVHGPKRRLSERMLPGVSVNTDVYVRVLPAPWRRTRANERAVKRWVHQAIRWDEPDALAVALQYVSGAPGVKDRRGLLYRGDAEFSNEIIGPDVNGADFYDYLGVNWGFPDVGRRVANPDEVRSVDCSGFLRLVWGYRLGMPLKWSNDGSRLALPRKADGIARYGPGVLVFSGTPAPSDLKALRPGDLVFFDTDNDGIYNHSGMYVGIDSRGSQRFISSRGAANGPTMGDRGASSTIGDDGHYSHMLAAARRL